MAEQNVFLKSTPLIIPRSEHPISRRMIDEEALKVLYRLHRHGFLAYLVGGSVRDLLLGKVPIQKGTVPISHKKRPLKQLVCAISR